MPTTYTSLLGLALPATGELSGLWGDTVNNYISQYLDAAIAGAQTISGTQTAVTLSTANGTSLSQAGTGTTGSAQYRIINCTGSPAGTLTVTVPASSRVYLVLNSTSTSQSVKIVGAGPTTGVTLVSGEKALIAWNGSDFVKVGSTAAAGSTTQVQYNSGGLLTGSSNFVFDGANVGIGATPGARLTVQDSAQLLATFNSTNVNAGYIQLQSSGTNYGYFGSAAALASGAATDVALRYQNKLVLSYQGATATAVLDSSGNLGLGTTTSSWKTGYKALETSYGSFSTADNATTRLALNSYYSSTGWVNRNTGNSLLFELVNGGGFQWQIAPSAIAGATPTFSTAMTLDASGNLGLGVTPSAWSASFKALQVSNFGIMVGNTGNTYQLGNAYFDGSAYKYLASSYALKYEMVAGAHAWYTAPSGTAGNAITFTQAMTLDSAGQLGIGSTPNAPLSVRKDSSNWEVARLFNSTAGCVIQFNNAVTPAYGWDVGVPNADQFNVRRNASAVFSIDSSGRAMVGTVSVLTGNPALSVKSISQYTATFQQYQNLDYVGVRIENVYAQSAQNATMVQLVNSGGTEVGSIKSTGSATSFNTSSDRRLKSNITAAGDSSIVDDIEVVQYDWSNGGGHVSFGVIAQDLHGVFPDAVSAGDGGVDVSSPWGVDYSKLVPLLLKEIQQLRSRVAILESK